MISFKDRYSVGDIIVVIDSIDDLYMAGKEGTIIYVDDNAVGIQFDEPFDEGHNCGNHGADGRCRWCYDISEISHVFELYDDKEMETGHNFDEIDSSVIDLFLKGFKKGV